MNYSLVKTAGAYTDFCALAQWEGMLANTSQQHGKRMLTAALLVMSADATLAQTPIAAPPSTTQNCSLKRYDSIEIKISDQHVLVPVTVEHKAAFMLLNTSAAPSIMRSYAPQEFGLSVRKIPGASPGSNAITHTATARSFTLGHLAFDGKQFWLLPVPKPAERIDGALIAGELGMDFFANMDFELDFKNAHLNLYSQDHCPGKVVYWTDTAASTPMHRGPAGNAYFPMVLEGKKVAATLATWTAYTTLTTDVTKRLYGFDEHSPDIETAGGADGRVRSYYRAMALTTPGPEVINTRVELVPRPGTCTLDTGHGPDGVARYTNCIGIEAPLFLGMNVLSGLHLYFATRENVLYFTLADSKLMPAGTQATPVNP